MKLSENDTLQMSYQQVLQHASYIIHRAPRGECTYHADMADAKRAMYKLLRNCNLHVLDNADLLIPRPAHADMDAEELTALARRYDTSLSVARVVEL